MKTRWATLWELVEAFGFLIANADHNALDHRIFTYPTTKVMRAEVEGVAHAYMPVHNGAILESLGWAEGLGAKEKFRAAAALVSALQIEAHNSGIREMYFISSDERTDEAAVKLGFEKVTCFRKRL